MSDSRDAALRHLRGAYDSLTSLRFGTDDPAAQREAIARVHDAVEAAFRRLLRDDGSFPLELRLRALAPDELSGEEVVSSLRQRDRIGIELAAAFHDLAGVRRRVAGGAEPTRRDADLALQVAERAEREILAAPAAPAATPSDPAHDISRDAAAPPRIGRSRGGSRALAGGALLALAVMLLAAGLWWTASRRAPSYSEAIALFRTGDFARAEALFERHTADRPADATPRLYLARIYRRTGRLDEAREQLRQGLAASPDDPALHRELGWVLLDGGRPDVAAGRFREAVERDPDAAEGWVGLIRALRESGQDAAADRVLAQAPAQVRTLIDQRARPAGR